jgi:hypothetical protein
MLRRVRTAAAHAHGGSTPPPAIEALLVGTGAHELGYGGASELIDGLLRPLGYGPHETALWLALGASILTYADDGPTAASATPAPTGPTAASATQPTRAAPGRAAAVRAATPSRTPRPVFFSQLDYTKADLSAALSPYAAAGFRPSLDPPDRRGELLPIAAAGFRAVGFYGEHALFHTPLDGANATSDELLERVARPTLAMLERVVGDAFTRAATPRAHRPASEVRERARQPASRSTALAATVLPALLVGLTVVLLWTVGSPAGASWRTKEVML